VTVVVSTSGADFTTADDLLSQAELALTADRAADHAAGDRAPDHAAGVRAW
jgi:hypothetical protein